MCDLLPGVQALWTCTGTVQYGMAAVELELIIYGIQSLLGIFITAVTYPPAFTTMRQKNSTLQKYLKPHLVLIKETVDTKLTMKMYK